MQNATAAAAAATAVDIAACAAVALRCTQFNRIQSDGRQEHASMCPNQKGAFVRVLAYTMHSSFTMVNTQQAPHIHIWTGIPINTSTGVRLHKYRCAYVSLSLCLCVSAPCSWRIARREWRLHSRPQHTIHNKTMLVRMEIEL